MSKEKEKVIEGMAKVGYENMFDERWDDLPLNSIERALWLQISSSMLDELRRLWQSEKDRLSQQVMREEL